MRKMLVLLVAILFLSSCTKIETPPPSDFGEDAVVVSFKWAADKGVYFTATSNFLNGIKPGPDFGPGDYDDFIDDPLLLYITDAATSNDIILCNRPDCPHISEDCNAYLPYDDYSDSREIDLRSTSIVFADGETVYAHNAGSRIFRFNLDGTGRDVAARLPGMYSGLSGGWLMNGRLYTQAFCYKAVEYGTAVTKVLLEINYRNGEVREIWEETQAPNSDSGIAAVSGGVFYGFEKIYPYRAPLSFAADSERLDFHDSTEYILFSVDPGDDTIQTKILHRGMGDEFNPCKTIDFSGETPGMVYHSRRDESVYRIDLTTGEPAKIAENIPGTWQINGVFGGRLFMVDFMRFNEEGLRMVADGSVMRSDDNRFQMYEALYTVDTATGEMSQSAIITRRTLIENGYTGISDGFTDIIVEKDGYFYIEIERTEEEYDVWGNGKTIYIYLDRHLIGRIPIEDYWTGNAAAIEALGWVSFEEFAMMRLGLSAF